MRATVIDMKGRRVGCWLVKDPADVRSGTAMQWTCECVLCGHRQVVPGWKLRQGKLTWVCAGDRVMHRGQPSKSARRVTMAAKARRAGISPELVRQRKWAGVPEKD